MEERKSPVRLPRASIANKHARNKIAQNKRVTKVHVNKMIKVHLRGELAKIRDKIKYAVTVGSYEISYSTPDDLSHYFRVELLKAVTAKMVEYGYAWRDIHPWDNMNVAFVWSIPNR